jgi:putative Mn2+ efflux pump MntP
LLLAGMGLTFGLLWTMRASQPTAWAMFPAIGLFIAAGIVFFVESPSDIIGPLLLVVVGVVILLGSVIRKPSVSPPVESLDDK